MCQTRIRLHDSPGYSHPNGPWYFRPWKCAICSYRIVSREPKFSLPKRELIPFLIRGSVFLFLSQMSSTGDAVPPQSLPCVSIQLVECARMFARPPLPSSFPSALSVSTADVLSSAKLEARRKWPRPFASSPEDCEDDRLSTGRELEWTRTPSCRCYNGNY